MCAACAEKCSKPDTLERKKNAYAFFACKCNDTSPGTTQSIFLFFLVAVCSFLFQVANISCAEGCKCFETEPPAEKPSRLIRIFPVYQLDNTGLKAQFMSSVEAVALTPANHPCPSNELTYFEMTVVKAGEEKCALDIKIASCCPDLHTGSLPLVSLTSRCVARPSGPAGAATHSVTTAMMAVCLPDVLAAVCRHTKIMVLRMRTETSLAAAMTPRTSRCSLPTTARCSHTAYRM